MAFLREVAVALTFPLALTLLVLLVALVAWRLRWRRVSAVLAVLAIAWSGFWSIPRNAEWLRGSLQERHAFAPVEQVPAADAVVVLGGGGYNWLDRPGVTLESLK